MGRFGSGRTAPARPVRCCRRSSRPPPTTSASSSSFQKTSRPSSVGGRSFERSSAPSGIRGGRTTILEDPAAVRRWSPSTLRCVSIPYDPDAQEVDVVSINAELLPFLDQFPQLELTKENLRQTRRELNRMSRAAVAAAPSVPSGHIGSSM